jgi:hypothetical protein
MSALGHVISTAPHHPFTIYKGSTPLQPAFFFFNTITYFLNVIWLHKVNRLKPKGAPEDISDELGLVDAIDKLRSQAISQK